METRLLKELRGKPIFDMQEGRKIGTFEDLLIAPGDFHTLAIITTRMLLLNRKVEALPAEEVRLWGRDVILAARPDAIRAREAISGLEQALLASTVLKGRSVISTDGQRLGVADDFYINAQGRLEAVRLSQTSHNGPVSHLKMLPISALRSLGPDVIIVEMDRMMFVERDAQPGLAQPGSAPAAMPDSDPTPTLEDVAAAPLAAAPDGSLYGVDTSMLPTLPTRPHELQPERPGEAQGAMIFPARER
jgi:uncharacterized protein YrrD